jgi:glycosyltransferase involved in cell wall biosynthesis
MSSLVVVCTRNRPHDVREVLSHVRKVSPDLPVLVADSSDGPDKARVESVVAEVDGCTLIACTPGLARQRNQGLAWISEHSPDTEVVHFLDDDSEPMPGYFEAIESRFAASREVGGVGGVIVNQPLPRFLAAKYAFWLYSRRPGVVLRSGRSTIGHYQGHEARAAQWLPGCAMSYRLDAIGDLRFDDRLEGYSLGEDLYFSFALSRCHELTIAENALQIHHLSPTNRQSAERVSRERIELLHRFVRENHDRGLRLYAFWWSVLGESLLHLVHGLAARDAEALARARGVAVGGLRSLMHPLPSRASAR